MKKRIFKKTFPVQYLYPNNTDVFQFIEDYYTVFEGEIDGIKVCFYNRNKSVLNKSIDQGKTYEKTIEFENPSYFIALDCTFEEIQNEVIGIDDGLLEIIE